MHSSFDTKYDTFTLPHNNVLTSGFGYRRGGFHKGIDIRLEKGTKVKAAFNGKVRYARYNSGGFGNLVIIRHFNGLETYYAHLSKLLVKENEIIESGKVIGLGGNTGVEWSGTHLHFEVRYRDLSFDPQKMISLDNENLISQELVLRKKDFHPAIQNKRKYHKIKSGDTLSHLARKYSTSTSRIVKINKGLTINSTLRIGQRIRVR
jgi:Membrane proteins related to metalloendopeptidases